MSISKIYDIKRKICVSKLKKNYFKKLEEFEKIKFFCEPKENQIVIFFFQCNIKRWIFWSKRYFDESSRYWCTIMKTWFFNFFETFWNWKLFGAVHCVNALHWIGVFFQLRSAWSWWINIILQNIDILSKHWETEKIRKKPSYSSNKIQKKKVFLRTRWIDCWQNFHCNVKNKLE